MQSYDTGWIELIISIKNKLSKNCLKEEFNKQSTDKNNLIIFSFNYSPCLLYREFY